MHYGYIVDKEENVIDEVMVVVMKAPKSYTTEDTVEINCHGGVLAVSYTHLDVYKRQILLTSFRVLPGTTTFFGA